MTDTGASSSRPPSVRLAALRLALLLVSLSLTSACLRGPGTAGTVHYAQAGLDAYEVGEGRRPFLLLHGYSATPEEWLPFAHTIQAGTDRLFLFPRAPESTSPPDGPSGGRAWWRLELASYRGDDRSLPDMASASPPGIRASRDRIRALLAELRARPGIAGDRVIVGGFSQGAMVTAQIAFTSGEPLQAIVLLSPTPVDLAAWTRGMPARRGLPVFIAHGRQDDVLPFAGSERLVAVMRDQGLAVTWVPFDGLHEVPALVVTRLSSFLQRVDAASEPAPRPAPVSR